MSTYSPKPGEITRNWHVIDAEGLVLGKLAVACATLLRGKHKATFAPHVDGGDFVIVVNASKIALTGNKATTKMAYRHSGTPGGLRAVPYGELLANAGTPVEVHNAERLVHGYLGYAGVVHAATEATNRGLSALKKALHP